ncbi:hypothetical protein Tco_0385442 [Tanacetum coccineum]
MSKLDRFLVFESFYEVFPHGTGLVLEKGILDHRPILLKESIMDYGPTPFWFFHFWLEMDGFHDLVAQTWNNNGIVDRNGFILYKKKLQNLKMVIWVWIASQKDDTYTLKKEHHHRLSIIDSKIDQGCASEANFMNRRDSLSILGDMDRLEAKDYAQKAKTSFFHGTLKKKRRQLAIRGILKNGEWIEAHDIVKEDFLMHFCNQFKKPISPPTVIYSLAVWDYSGDHSPGLDGFTFYFFTTFLDIIEEDTVRFVQEFSISHEFPKGCNPSFIALIPKVPNAKFVYDFQPISLIGCQYKIIGKLLANRLSNVIEDCVSPVQSTFIKGRYILDGTLILNEILAEYRHQHKVLLLFKVDLRKPSTRASNKEILYLLSFSSWRWKAYIPLRVRPKRLKTNVDKSNVLGVGVSDKEISQMARIIGCGVSKLPFKYLGVPVESRLLSVGGRLLLIKVVLGNLPTYFMYIYLMPISIRSKLESMRNKFFGGADQNDSKMSWVKWEKCLSSKIKGGLGAFMAIMEAFSMIRIDGLSKLPGALFFHRLNILRIKIYNLDTERNYLIVNRIPLLHSDWSMVLRRIPRGGVESNQFEALKAAIGNVFLTDQSDTWQWTLDVAAGYSMASARVLVDA